MTIYQDDLDFVKEAAEAFNKNVRWETYRNEEATLIALREGVHRDGMVVYRLGQHVGDFREVSNKAPDLVTIKQREQAMREARSKICGMKPSVAICDEE